MSGEAEPGADRQAPRDPRIHRLRQRRGDSWRCDETDPGSRQPIDPLPVGTARGTRADRLGTSAGLPGNRSRSTARWRPSFADGRWARRPAAARFLEEARCLARVGIPTSSPFTVQCRSGRVGLWTDPSVGRRSRHRSSMAVHSGAGGDAHWDRSMPGADGSACRGIDPRRCQSGQRHAGGRRAVPAIDFGAARGHGGARRRATDTWPWARLREADGLRCLKCWVATADSTSDLFPGSAAFWLVSRRSAVPARGVGVLVEKHRQADRVPLLDVRAACPGVRSGRRASHGTRPGGPFPEPRRARGCPRGRGARHGGLRRGWKAGGGSRSSEQN